MASFDDDLQLQPYLVAISKRWKIAIFLGIITGLIGLVISLSQPKEYQSTATVIATHTQLRLALAEQFPTLNENRDTKSRMDAYLTIAQSDYIAQATSQRSSSNLPREFQNPSALKALVDVTTKGYAINITANTISPELSAEIANNWADETTKAINLAYSGDQPLGEIQNQIKQAESDYASSQGELESFIKESKATALEKKIAESDALINATVADRAWLYYYYFNRKQYLEDLVFQLETLKEQVNRNQGSNAGNLGDALAVIAVRMNSLGINQNAGSTSVTVTQPEQPDTITSASSIEFAPAGGRSQPSLFYQLPGLDTLIDQQTNYRADVEQLLILASTEQKRVSEELQKFNSEDFLAKTDPSFDKLTSYVQSLQAELEFEHARKAELIAKRDLMLDTLKALQQKEKELQTSAQSSNEVAVASPAVPPNIANSRGIVLDTLISAAIGFFLGIFWIIISQWWSMFGSGKSEDIENPGVG